MPPSGTAPLPHRPVVVGSGPGGLVYDNQLNAPDSIHPTTLLGGGSINIHK